MLKSIKNDVSFIGVLLLFIAIGLLFSSDKVTISNNSIPIEQEEFNISTAVKPDTYCSEDGIEYWINGFTKTYSNSSSSKVQYILSVVYDKNQKPKKCDVHNGK